MSYERMGEFGKVIYDIMFCEGEYDDAAVSHHVSFSSPCHLSDEHAVELVQRARERVILHRQQSEILHGASGHAGVGTTGHLAEGMDRRVSVMCQRI